jgi:hypothetical protein
MGGLRENLLQVRHRRARWRAYATYRRMFRQQLRQQRLARKVRRRRDRFDGRSAWQTVLITSVAILSAVVGYAAFRAPGVSGDGRPSADGTVRSASDDSARDGRRGGMPGLTRPGIYVSVAVTSVGDLEVVERARFGEALLEVSLAPPPALTDAGGTPRLADVQVSADGEPVPVPGTIEEAVEVALAGPATRIELRYRVVGAVARSEPATPGRATLSLRPALAATLASSRAVVEVHGAEVHNLVCVDRPRADQLCGVDRGDGWRTRRLPTASSAVVALVDLPEPPT